MQTQLTRERRAMEGQWAEREKQIQRLIGSTSPKYGALQGIVGAGLGTIRARKLPGHSARAPERSLVWSPVRSPSWGRGPNQVGSLISIARKLAIASPLPPYRWFFLKRDGHPGRFRLACRKKPRAGFPALEDKLDGG